ncbi:ArsR family transcriptional regulator [Arthrobacter sp. D1-29]
MTVELQNPATARRMLNEDPARRKEERRRPIRSQIIDYLASNGASKVADISSDIICSRDCVRYHLAALEKAAIVRSNISPGTREGFTPFYALTPAAASVRVQPRPQKTSS